VVDNSTGLNQGMVSISGLNAFGISSTGNGSTLANQGTVTTAGSRGFGLDARGSNSMLINSGTINVSGPNLAGIRSTDPRPFRCSARPSAGLRLPGTRLTF